MTVSLKTEVVIKIFEFEIKASSTTLQFLSVHKNSLQFQTVDVNGAVVVVVVVVVGVADLHWWLLSKRVGNTKAVKNHKVFIVNVV